MWTPSINYRNPFIVEAVLDIQTSASPAGGEFALGDFLSRHDDYPERDDFTSQVVSLTAGDSVSANVDSEEKGFSFRSASGKRLVRVLPDRLIFSEFSPYTGWDAFASEGLRLWRRFMSRQNPLGVKRVGVRYINRIEIDAAEAPVRMEDYFHTYPAMSYDISAPMNKFFMSTQYNFPKEQAAATVTQASTEATRPNALGILLDIDVWRDQETGLDSSNISLDTRQIIEELRAVKNSLFEACITNQLRELMQ
ncbi:TIGR04255 family protein [Actinoplanes sp. NPDC000266]